MTWKNAKTNERIEQYHREVVQSPEGMRQLTRDELRLNEGVYSFVGRVASIIENDQIMDWDILVEGPVVLTVQYGHPTLYWLENFDAEFSSGDMVDDGTLVLSDHDVHHELRLFVPLDEPAQNDVSIPESENDPMATNKFDPAVKAAVDKLMLVEKDLNADIVERTEAIHLILIAILMKQHLAFKSAPGEAKSMVLDRFAQHFGGGLKVFKHPGISMYTTPDQLVGAIDPGQLMAGVTAINTFDMMTESHLSILDEVFRGGVIKDTLLSLMDEQRLFRNGNNLQKIPLMSVLIASNSWPEDESDAAFWDRIAIRYQYDTLSAAGFAALLNLKANGNGHPTISTTMTWDELDLLQTTVKSIPIPGSIQQTLCELREKLRVNGIEPSPRRWVWAMDALRASALLDGTTVIAEEHLDVLEHILWQTPEQRNGIAKHINAVASPMLAQVKEWHDQAKSLYAELEKNRNHKEFARLLLQTTQSISGLSKQAETLIAQAKAEGRPTTKLQTKANEIAQMFANAASFFRAK